MDDCYVYKHTSPDETLMYVGMGRGHRCLDTHRRLPEHTNFMLEQIKTSGLTFVSLHAFGLSEKEARTIEMGLIKTLKPPLNRQMNGSANAGRGKDNHNAAFNDEDVRRIRSEWDTWDGSMRKFHTAVAPQVQFTTLRKLVLGVSYTDVE